MAKPKPKRKTRPDKFPLTLHPTGQYCKRIKRKLYYFGVDKRKALERYLEQAAFLHTGIFVSFPACNCREAANTL